LDDFTYLMRPLVLAQITAIRTRKVAESALMWFLPLMQRADVRLQLRMRRRRVSATITHIRSLPRMRPLVVVFRLVRCKCFVAASIATRVRPVAGVAEQVA
jgi:hypothetical protein